MYLDSPTDVPGPNIGWQAVFGSYEAHTTSFAEKDPSLAARGSLPHKRSSRFLAIVQWIIVDPASKPYDAP